MDLPQIGESLEVFYRTKYLSDLNHKLVYIQQNFIKNLYKSRIIQRSHNYGRCVKAILQFNFPRCYIFISRRKFNPLFCNAPLSLIHSLCQPPSFVADAITEFVIPQQHFPQHFPNNINSSRYSTMKYNATLCGHNQNVMVFKLCFD